MDKNIYDNDRIIIGVREWAIERALGDFWIDTNLVKAIRDGGTTQEVTKVAKELEEYILEGIKG